MMERTTSPTASLVSPSSTGGERVYLNRDLAWLEFNCRVLHEAMDERTPLLERVRFLAIFNSNLDEFVQKRMGSLKCQMVANVYTVGEDGFSLAQLLDGLRRRMIELHQMQADCFNHRIRPALAEKGIYLLDWKDLGEEERGWCERYFRDHLFPVLTPLAVDPGHPFPFLSNLSLSLGVMLKHPGEWGGVGDSSSLTVTTDRKGVGGGEGTGDEPWHFARVKVPTMFPKWIRIAGAGSEGKDVYRFVRLEQVIRFHLQSLFEGMEIIDIEPFRITRNAEIERDEEDAEDLLELIEQELHDRRFAQIVRLQMDDRPNVVLKRFLMEQLEVEESDVYSMPDELDYSSLHVIAELNRPELKYPGWSPVVPGRLADDEADIFSLIRQGDILVHHPYESFKASVERFISSAATDPKVIAIKVTLYRTVPDSPFLVDLIRAAQAGKQVAVLVEIKARFDEELNLRIAQRLEKAGVHVVYGIVGLKTHTKTALVVRQDGDGTRTYAHISTGNYNSKTAQVYTDLGLFTCRPEITGDLVELFHSLTGRSIKQNFKTLLVAPTNMSARFLEMIDREIGLAGAWRERGGRADDPLRPRIIAKMNSLEDPQIIEKLYEASKAGVRIDLIVRGICCLRPGVAGLSENISVISVIGRFLEHSRIFYFHNNNRPEYYIGSADWMYRNLHRRVECLTPVYDAGLQARLQQILVTMLGDCRQAWEMASDGSYVQRMPGEGQVGGVVGAQVGGGTHQQLMEMTKAAGTVGGAGAGV